MADQSSHATSAMGSDAGSSAVGGPKKHKAKGTMGNNDDEKNLLDEKKSTEEALFACMYALVKERGQDSWQYSYFKVAMEGLVAFLVVFNPNRADWAIDTTNQLWMIVRWADFRNPIAEIFGYTIYVNILYALVVITMTVLAAVGFLAYLMRKSDQVKWIKNFAKTLQVFTDVIFSILYMTILDYLMFMWSCKYTSTPILHSYFVGVQCFASPHLGPMFMAGIAAIIFIFATVAVQTSGCELNPCAHGLLASPAAMMKIKVVFVKAAFVIAANVLFFIAKPQTLLMTALALYVFWLNVDNMAFFQTHISCIWCGMWLGVTYTTIIFTALNLSSDGSDPAYQNSLTNAVLYGIFPVMAFGGLIAWGYFRWRMRHVKNFEEANVDEVKLKKIYRFHSPAEVELLSRTMRKFDLDGVIDPKAAELGELIIKAGLATYPDSANLLILNANFMMEVKKDGPGSRTQLQLVSKHNPNFVQRYKIFFTIENSKRLKESAEQGMDLHSYVEFKRNYRAVLRAHKETLSLIREVWRLMLKAEPKAVRIDNALAELDISVQRTHRIYRKVLERYPKNGKLLKCYGRFQEDVRNDFKSAARNYAEATKQGGSGNGILSMDFDFASQPGKPEMLLSIDVNEDALAIINAEGTIMVVSQGVTDLFGYNKAELENQNIALLMPPPFSQRHASYLQRYKEGGEPRILDMVKEVVALHKDKHVFPVQICVTKLSGVGAEAVFLGLMRPIPFSKRDVRAWIAPNGTILCCGPMFSALTGIPADEMVGVNVKTMMADQDAFEMMLQQGTAASTQDFEDGKLNMDVSLLNKYTGKISCHLNFSLGGSEQTRLFVMHLHRNDGMDDNLLVVDEFGNITFATIDLAVTLGYSLKAFMKLKLEDLLPPPINTMHDRFLRDSAPSFPVTSCRAGAIVFLVSSTGVQIPVRIQLNQREEPTGLKHVTKITKVTDSEYLNDRRIEVITNFDGTIQDILPANCMIFGFPTDTLKGMNVCEIIDVFSEWKTKTSSTDMQLLMLALVDKENEMPGSCWRIKMTPPMASSGQVVALPSIPTATARGSASNIAAARRQPRSCIMQTSLVEAKRQGNNRESAAQLDISIPEGPAPVVAATALNERPRVKLVLWKRELLVGTMELDAGLRIRRAGPMAGLIMGRPTSALIKQPMYRLLPSIPKRTGWDEVMGVKQAKKSTMKAAVATSKLTSIRSFEGHHPDGGSMRILVQGIMITDSSNGKSRIEICIKPDMTFTAAHSDIWGALGLNHIDEEEGEEDVGRGGRGSHSGSSRSSGAETAATGAAAEAASHKLRAKQLQGLPVAGDGKEDPGGVLVERWFSTVDRQDGNAADTGKPRTARFSVEEPGRARPSGEEGGGAGQGDWRKLLEAIPDEAMSMPVKHHHHLGVAAGGGGKEGKPEGGGSDGGGNDAQSDGGSSDGGSSANDDGQGSMYSTQNETHVDEILVDTRRSKLLSKLNKLLLSLAMTDPVEKLRVYTWINLAFILIMRVICFAVLFSIIQTRYENMYLVDYTAQANDRSQSAAVQTQIIMYCKGLPPGSPLLVNDCAINSNIDYANTVLLDVIADMELAHQGVFLGLEGKVKKIADTETLSIWSNDAPNLNFSVYLDTNPPQTQYEQKGVWELGNRFIAACREILYLAKTNTTAQIKSSRPYYFLTVNGPGMLFWGYETALDSLTLYAQEQLKKLYDDSVILMVFEAIVVIPLCCLWMYFLIRRAEGVRLLHWLLMVGLPGPVLKALCNRPIKVPEDSDEEDEEESDSEEGDDKPKAGAGAGAPPFDALDSAVPPPQPKGGESGDGEGDDDGEVAAAPAPGAGIVVASATGKKKRTILPTHKNTLIFMVPLATWFLVMIACYAAILAMLADMINPLASLSMSMRVLYRFSHLRFIAFELISQSTNAGRDYWRAELTHVIANLTSEYDTLLYGGVASTQTGTSFTESSPASAFTSPKLSALFFSATQCFRKNATTCAPANSTWYEITHRGLDAMMRRILADMTLLSNDNNTDLVITNPRYETLFAVGAYDLYDGLHQASELFITESLTTYNTVKLLEILTLVFSFVLSGAYLYWVLRPYLGLHQVEAGKVAGLMSMVPHEVDATAHVRRIMREEAAKRRSKKKVKGKGGEGKADAKSYRSGGNSHGTEVKSALSSMFASSVFQKEKGKSGGGYGKV